MRLRILPSEMPLIWMRLGYELPMECILNGTVGSALVPRYPMMEVDLSTKLKILAFSGLVTFVTASANMVDILPLANGTRGALGIVFLLSIILDIVLLILISREAAQERKNLPPVQPFKYNIQVDDRDHSIDE